MALIGIILASASVGYLVLQGGQGNPCDPLSGARVLKSSTSTLEFDAVKKYHLPSPGRFPNALTTASDGSVWFGEQSVPGVAHLYQNGSLIEYAWPGSSSRTTATGACQFKTSIWGIAVWNGRVWGTDGDGNRIIGLNPSNKAFDVLPVPGNNTFPYSLAVAPDNSLWFTMLSSPPRLGRIDAQEQIHMYPLPADAKDIPADISFQNSTTAYFIGIEAQAGRGNLYEFDPTGTGPTIDATNVGGTFKLLAPNSISANGDSIWVTQHGASSLASYSIKAGTWRVFPTSTEIYTSTTLPYAVRLNGSYVWFNEHIGNKIAVIDTLTSTLTEYSLSNPPATSASQIGNALTISLGRDRTWFAEATANDVGFVDAGNRSSFGVSLVGGNLVSLQRGSVRPVALELLGESKTPLHLKFSDSESSSSELRSITIASNVSTVASFSSDKMIPMTIGADSNLAPGNYTVAITATNGLVSRSVFVYVTVS